jgi:hypothetical protein
MNDTFVTEYEYTFPPVDMTYDEIDLPIIRGIATLLYLDVDISVWDKKSFYPIWYVKNKKPYLDSVYIRHTVNKRECFTSIDIEGHLKCENRDLIISLLDNIIGQNELRDKTVVTLKIHSPNISNMRPLAEHIESIWDIVWNKFEGDLPAEMGTPNWTQTRRGFTLACIVTGRLDLHFTYDYSFSLVVNGVVYRYSQRELEDKDCICKTILNEWIKRANAIYVSNWLQEDWIMETEMYKSYNQWLPREVLDDTIALL